jgi:hypothetical protein
MRSKRDRRPHWSTLNLILLAAVGGLALERGLHLTPTGHEITLLLIIAVIYGLMAAWVTSNAAALEDLDAEEYRKQSRNPAVYGTPESPTSAQAHFRETVSFYRHESPDKQERP